MIRRILSFLLCIGLSMVCLSGCFLPNEGSESAEGKLRIVATLFPQYDFAKAIAGDKADVSLLLPPGAESHNYEPTPQDILSIHNADLFLYTGAEMEPWAESLVESLPTRDSVVDVSAGISLIPMEEEAGHAHHEEEHTHHHHTYDPHIWTSPVYAKQIVQTICRALCAHDPQNAAYYRANTQRYLAELETLNQAFLSVTAQAKRKELIFGSPFSLYYFTSQYGLSYQAAFDSCSGESEPSVRTLVSLIEHIKKEKIPVVYTTELSDTRIAQTICEETGAKLLLFHSCHNISREEFQQGATYLSLMYQNVENLKEGLE